MEGFINSFDRKLELIIKKLNLHWLKEIKAISILAILEDFISDLKMEKLEPSNIDDTLRKENRNLCQTLSEARDKILDFQSKFTNCVEINSTGWKTGIGN